jgi:hypothetical protein
MVMAATGHGWLQVSPMFNTREAADSHMTVNLMDGRKIPATAKDGANAHKQDVSGCIIRVFEIK